LKVTHLPLQNVDISLKVTHLSLQDVDIPLKVTHLPLQDVDIPLKVAHLPCHLLQFLVAHAFPRADDDDNIVAPHGNKAIDVPGAYVGRRGQIAPENAEGNAGVRKTAVRRLKNLRSVGGG
jgi:hypothetical protein